MVIIFFQLFDCFNDMRRFNTETIPIVIGTAELNEGS